MTQGMCCVAVTVYLVRKEGRTVISYTIAQMIEISAWSC